MSIGPCRASASWHARSASAGTPTSAWIAKAERPSFADVGGGGLQAGGLPAHEDHVGARLREAQRHLAAEPAAAPRDEPSFPVEPEPIEHAHLSHSSGPRARGRAYHSALPEPRQGEGPETCRPGDIRATFPGHESAVEAERSGGPAEAGEVARRLAANIERVMLGQAGPTRKLLAAFASGGHVLLEDFPGTGKTTLAKALARSIGARFRRIQFTPDLLPSDILGVSVYDPRDQALPLPPGAGLHEHPPRRRDQPRLAPHPVGAPRGDGGGPGDDRGRDACRWSSSSS